MSDAKEPSEAAKAVCGCRECLGLHLWVPVVCKAARIQAAIDTAVQAEREALILFLSDLDDFTESIVGGLREAIQRGDHISPEHTPTKPTGGR